MQKPVHLGLQFIIGCCLMLWLNLAQADVVISDAWVRASNPGQSVGAAYMMLRSNEDMTLVFVETERAGYTEIHSMTMQNGVMKMRHLEVLSLPANQLVKLAPGNFHLMLFELGSPFKAGEQVKFRLCFKDKSGHIHEQFISVPVKAVS
jgi:periplasmic copper chaperone A